MVSARVLADLGCAAVNFVCQRFFGHAVVDLFKDWFGYCSVMEPTYNSLFNELDDFDNRVKLLAVSFVAGSQR